MTSHFNFKSSPFKKKIPLCLSFNSVVRPLERKQGRGHRLVEEQSCEKMGHLQQKIFGCRGSVILAYTK